MARCRTSRSIPFPGERLLPQSLAATALHLGCTAALLALVTPLSAQMHKVEKPEKVTRAVGVYEWTGNLPNPTAARLVPVTIFIDGHLEDAGVYLSRPVPFAIQTGVVYAVQKAGEPFGTLTIDSARDVITRHSGEEDNPVGTWFGYGSFAAPKAEVVAKLQPSKTLPAITSTADPDDKPHFSGDRSSGTSVPATTKPAPQPASQPTASTPAPSKPAVNVDTGDDDDQPHMSRRSDSDSGSTTSSSGTGTTNNPPDADDPDRPTLGHRTDASDNKKPKKEKVREEGYVEGAGTPMADDPNRPTMHRGKPLGAAKVPQLTGNPPTMHQAVAVSDANIRDPHEFAREWNSATERAETLAALEQLARPRIQNYVVRNEMQIAFPAPADAATPADVPTKQTSTAAHRKAAAPVPAPPPPPIPLNDEQLNGYLLSYGGLPTFVFTAETPLEAGGPVFITLVAQKLPSGEIQLSLASVTDANHLDRTPWLRLVDAVDPDDSHRASLLFELRAQSTRQFALYRLITAQAEQTFSTSIIE